MVSARQELEKSPTRLLSEFIAAARYEDIPDSLREEVKLYILDSLGCAIGGSRLKPARILIRFFDGLGGSPESTVHGTGKRMPCIHAAYVNSYLANLLDADDTLIGKAGGGHPGAMVVQPALAVAEKIGASGKETIQAIVLGYEIALRIMNAMAPTADRRLQVWGQATFLIFGALTASCKLLGLNADQVVSAFGLAGFSAPVPFLRKMGSDQKPVSWLKNNFGWAAMGGVLSALQAAAGFQGSTSILDGERGFWAMAGSDQCDFEGLARGLGHFSLHPISLKPYASCRYTHTALDALRQMKAAQEIPPENIARIRVRTFYEAYKLKIEPHLNTIDAQFSLPYLMALELLGRSPSQGLAEEDLEDERVLKMADRVCLELDPEADRAFVERRLMPAAITIEMKDGRTFSGSADVPRGGMESPLTAEEIKDKFRGLVAPLWGKEQAERIIADCENLDRLPGPFRVHP